MSKPPSIVPTTVLHLDEIIHAFAVSEEELSLLVKGYDNIFKDLFNICISCGIPCSFNALCNHSQGLGDPVVFFNAVFGTVGVILSFTFFIMWKKEKKSVESQLQKIKDRKGINLSTLQKV